MGVAHFRPCRRAALLRGSRACWEAREGQGHRFRSVRSTGVNDCCAPARLVRALRVALAPSHMLPLATIALRPRGLPQRLP
ncbi:hypothetical protein ACFPRL_36275 [Pseudoclavibacter helvolus]